MNKYQDALETLSGITCMNYTNDGDYCVGGVVGDEFQKEIELLQEIIDFYIEIETLLPNQLKQIKKRFTNNP